jgi:KaiC/GvpD/RAD55 family RecA-like ATPase
MDDPLVLLQETFEREASGEDRPLSLPWQKLDFGLGGGLRPGTFNILVGEPGSAKTYIALSICLFAEHGGWKWAYWPLERDDAYAARRLQQASVAQADAVHREVSRRTRNRVAHCL